MIYSIVSKSIKICSFLGLMCIFSTQRSYGQAQPELQTKPYIEVTGYAEKKIVPDEIYLSITIKEREVGKDKISVEQQEAELKKAIIDLHIPIENLVIADGQADYIRIKWNKKDVVSKSEYELKLATAQQLVDVLRKIDELKIDKANISMVSHSKILEYKKEVDIEAIKSAKAKADYLLAAIGQQTGSALIINERTSNSYKLPQRSVTQAARYEDEFSSYEKTTEIIEFRKIHLETSIYVKFEIK